jgi:hypothetical protein
MSIGCRSVNVFPKHVGLPLVPLLPLLLAPPLLVPPLDEEAFPELPELEVPPPSGEGGSAFGVESLPTQAKTLRPPATPRPKHVRSHVTVT